MSSSGIIKQDPKERVEGDLSTVPAGAMQTLRRLPPAVLSSTPNPMGLVLALRRRWWLAIGLAILGSVLTVGGMWFLQKATYTARTTLFVPASVPPIFGPDNRANPANDQRTLAARVKSRRVVISALQEPNVKNLPIVLEQDEPIIWLESQLRVDFALSNEILRISMNGEDPKELTTLVDAVRNSFIKDIDVKENYEREERFKALNAVNATLRKALKKKELEQEPYRKILGSGNAEALTGLHELAVKDFGYAETEWLKARFDLIRARIEASMLPTKESPNPAFQVPNDILESFLAREPDVAALSREVSDLKNYTQHIERTAVDPAKAPGYTGMKKVLESRESELDALRKKRRPEVQTAILEKFAAEGKGFLPGTKQNIAILEQLEMLWKNLFDKRTEALDRFKEAAVTVEKLEEDMADEKQQLKRITSLIGALEIEKSAPKRIFSQDDTSVVPDLDGRIKKCAMGGAGVFALILFGIALLEFRQRRVNNVDEVVRGLDMHLMGTLPAIPQRTGLRSSGQSRDAHWQNILTESVDSARTMLLHMAKLESRKVVMITSAVGGEGKTLLSCHLAISLARAGLRTLLVDCDLRSAAVHKVFGLRGEPGFSNLLTGDVEVSAAVQEGPIAGLWVLPAGQSNSATFQALAQHKAKDVFKRLKDEFDFVLVDSAPLLPVADSLLVAPCVDAVILSILRDVSRLPTVYAAYERLAALRVHFLGAVVNGASGDYYHSRYPYPGAASAGPDAD